MVFESYEKSAESRAVVDGAPATEGEAAARRENPAHLPSTGQTVGKELQALLAEHEVEGCVRQGHLQRIPLVPLDVGANRASNCDHPGVDVKADHMPALDSLSGEASHNASTARDVHDTLARAGIS